MNEQTCFSGASGRYVTGSAKLISRGASADQFRTKMVFPKIREINLFGDPYNKDPAIQGTLLGSPSFGNSHMRDNSVWSRGTSRVHPLNPTDP